MTRKLVYALNNQYVFIDSVGYACEGIEIVVPDPSTNLYIINATLFKSNENFKFVASGTGDNPFTWDNNIVDFSTSITFDSTIY